jgi:hypothetical protein
VVTLIRGGALRLGRQRWQNREGKVMRGHAGDRAAPVYAAEAVKAARLRLLGLPSELRLTRGAGAP